MLTAEEAAARLAAIEDRQWRGRAEERARALPADLREVTRAFLVPAPADFRDFDDFQEFSRRQQAAAACLDQVTAPERASVMSALHPGLGTVLARWWTDEQARPYERDWRLKAFRAPRSPEVSRYQRGTDLRTIVHLAGPFDADPAWLAAWGGHLAARQGSNWTSVPAALGALLASAIDLGGAAGERALATLADVGHGTDPVGIMGQHVIVALLGAARPEGWDFIERLLLAARLQEGLRQSILEAAHLGHPAAFDRMLAIVVDHKLLRFTATVRAVAIWLGLGLEPGARMAPVPQAEARLRALAAFRAAEPRRQAALAGPDPWDALTALTAGGMTDVMATLPEARALAGSPSAGLRATAVRFAAATGVAEAIPLIIAALDDPDVRVAALAASLLPRSGADAPEAFDALERLIPRLPAKPWTEASLGVEHAPVTLGQAEAATILVRLVGDRPVASLLPWLPVMDATGRAMVASLLGGQPGRGQEKATPRELTAELRPVMIRLLGDRSPGVRSSALSALAKTRLAPAEAPAIEALLTRAATDTRRGALTLLMTLPPDAARQSAVRLAASADPRQQEAGAELLREIGQPAAPAAAPAAQASGSGLAGDAPAPAAPAPIEDLPATLASRLPRPAPPRLRELAPPDDRAAPILAAIDALAVAHRDVPVRVASWQGGKEMLFGDIAQFPWPFAPPWQGARFQPEDDSPPEAAMVLAEVFRGWWAGRPDELRGPGEGLDALHAYALAASAVQARAAGPDWLWPAARHLAGDPPADLRHPAAVRHVTSYLAAEHANGEVIDECLDALEAILARVPPEALVAAPDEAEGRAHLSPGQVASSDWRSRVCWYPWMALLTGLLQARPALFGPGQVERWYRLMRWVQRPHPDAKPLAVDERLLAMAHASGAASDDEAAAALLYPGSQLFAGLTRHRPGPLAARYPGLVPVADRVRDQVVAVELRRGDLPTPTSHTARNVSSICGVTLLAELLAKLGSAPLVRGGRYGPDSRDDVLSRLIRVSFPRPGEAGRDLAAAAAKAGVPLARLVDLALYAPQWAALTEQALGWPGLAEGVLWIHAHTRDQHWSVDAELRESWAAMVAERTPLSATDLLDGAVDVDWFRRVHDMLGAERWTALHKAARHASDGTAHARAQLFAEAMLGEANEAALSIRLTRHRYQDAARALGLLPLPADPAERQEAIARRYAVLREFERASKKAGMQRQVSERTAVRIAIENLARTAGYQDPLRFTWALEAQEAGDLADGPVIVTAGDVALTLSVDAEGTPDIAVSRSGRPLKSVPAALRKTPEVTALQARKATLATQAARVREALEAAMVAQDVFTPADFAELRRHPVVAPMLAQLVWAGEDGRTRWLSSDLGAASAAIPPGGSAAADAVPVEAAGQLRIAHPVDLAAEGSWVSWQERLFAAGRRQPFKQVFRELYVKTAQEIAESPVSQRYAGHQVQPRQAVALLARRGWLTGGTGDAVRAFHSHGLLARVQTDLDFSMAFSGFPGSVDGVWFTRRGEHLAQPLESVPDVAFSEAMRDLDLVVSVAHAGGVDPEATASTTEMRAALIRETARLLKLTNIAFAGDSHVIITGRLGEYSLHLGSGTVHRRPGGAVCIIPVGAQSRGRLFLPFADDDPKTAEIVSKALLLARDHEIKDPAILEQLRS
jgi:hypothetical protein